MRAFLTWPGVRVPVGRSPPAGAALVSLAWCCHPRSRCDQMQEARRADRGPQAARGRSAAAERLRAEAPLGARRPRGIEAHAKALVEHRAAEVGLVADRRIMTAAPGAGVAAERECGPDGARVESRAAGG